ncbi:hypothetical protein [Sulfolobus tengchongensis spindle-shaped virus 3]|nr:hypothetical protein [Sulfolobus tengchongensis spindle-shaped virus 3]
MVKSDMTQLTQQIVKTYKNDFLDLINKIEENEKKLQKILEVKLARYPESDSIKDDIQKEERYALNKISGEALEILYVVNGFKQNEDVNYIYDFYISASATHRAFEIYRALSGDEDKELIDKIHNRLQLLTNYAKVFLQNFAKFKNITIDDIYDKISDKLAKAIDKARELSAEITILINGLKSSKNANSKLYLAYASLLHKAQAILSQKIRQFDENKIKDDIIEYLFEFNKYLNLINHITYDIAVTYSDKFTTDVMEIAGRANELSYSLSQDLLDIVLLLTL